MIQQWMENAGVLRFPSSTVVQASQAQPHEWSWYKSLYAVVHCRSVEDFEALLPRRLDIDILARKAA